MTKDNALYVYYEIDIKTQKIDFVRCAFSYNGIPVIPENLKERLPFITKNKKDLLMLKMPLKEELTASSKTGKITFFRRFPLNVKEMLPITDSPSDEEIKSISNFLKSAAKKLMEELLINYELLNSSISIDNNNPFAIFTIKKEKKDIIKKERIKKLFYELCIKYVKMAYKEYIEMLNNLNLENSKIEDTPDDGEKLVLK